MKLLTAILFLLALFIIECNISVKCILFSTMCIVMAVWTATERLGTSLIAINKRLSNHHSNMIKASNAISQQSSEINNVKHELHSVDSRLSNVE